MISGRLADTLTQAGDADPEEGTSGGSMERRSRLDRCANAHQYESDSHEHTQGPDEPNNVGGKPVKPGIQPVTSALACRHGRAVAGTSCLDFLRADQARDPQRHESQADVHAPYPVERADPVGQEPHQEQDA